MEAGTPGAPPARAQVTVTPVAAVSGRLLALAGPGGPLRPGELLRLRLWDTGPPPAPPRYHLLVRPQPTLHVMCRVVCAPRVPWACRLSRVTCAVGTTPGVSSSRGPCACCVQRVRCVSHIMSSGCAACHVSRVTCALWVLRELSPVNTPCSVGIFCGLWPCCVAHGRHVWHNMLHITLCVPVVLLCVTCHMVVCHVTMSCPVCLLPLHVVCSCSVLCHLSCHMSSCVPRAHCACGVLCPVYMLCVGSHILCVVCCMSCVHVECCMLCVVCPMSTSCPMSMSHVMHISPTACPMCPLHVGCNTP